MLSEIKYPESSARWNKGCCWLLSGIGTPNIRVDSTRYGQLDIQSKQQQKRNFRGINNLQEVLLTMRSGCSHLEDKRLLIFLTSSSSSSSSMSRTLLNNQLRTHLVQTHRAAAATMEKTKATELNNRSVTLFWIVEIIIFVISNLDVHKYRKMFFP